MAKKLLHVKNIWDAKQKSLTATKVFDVKNF